MTPGRDGAAVPRLAAMTSPDPSPALDRARVQVVTLRPDALRGSTVRRVASVLAESFLTDPYTVSFLPAARRVERLTRKFSGAVRDALSPGPDGRVPGAVDVAVDPADGTVLAAALWGAPDAPRGTTVPAAVASVPGLLRVHGAHALDMALTVAACERARPTVPHWYLADLGTLPAARGRGAASALVRHRQRRADGTGIYLESSTRANVPFYARLGFAEIEPVRAFGTEDLTGMWWEAR